MEQNALSRHIGLEIHGLDLRAVDDEGARMLAGRLLRHLVLVIRDQELSSTDHVAFSRRFGELEEFPVHPALQDIGSPAVHIFRVANQTSHGYKGVGRYWHTDGYFYHQPTAVSMLRAVQLPDHGGDTWYANMYRAYESLSAESRQEIDGLTAISRPGPGSTPSGLFAGSAKSDVRHPLVRVHPVTGRKALYLNLRNIAVIEGLSWRETDALLARLTEHIDLRDFTYCHRWRAGDLVIWDNSAAAHKATPAPQGSLRVMERTTVVGREYFRSTFWKQAARLAVPA